MSEEYLNGFVNYLNVLTYLGNGLREPQNMEEIQRFSGGFHRALVFASDNISQEPKSGVNQ